MKRLTKKDGLGRYYSDYCGFEKQPEIQKLGQLEDIQDEIGIDLITLFKALKNGVYWKKPNGEVTFFLQNLRNAIYLTSFKGEFYFTFVTIYEYTKFETLGSVNIVDYGVTWALTKEELE